MPAVLRFGLPLTLLLVVVSPAAAQPRGGPGYFDHPENRRDAAADSARTLGGPWQLWTHAGIGWVSAPARVRERYKAGLVAGLSGDRRFGERVALRGRLDFNDLPPSNPQYISTN